MSKYADLAMERRSHFSPQGKPVHNCCQTVVAAFAQDLGYDEDAALRVGTYFRRGMQMGSVCGAITGGLMALGLAGIDDPALADGLFRKFRDRHDGTTNCGDLLRISAEKGEVKLDHCNALIRECIVYVEEALREKGRIE